VDEPPIAYSVVRNTGFCRVLRGRPRQEPYPCSECGRTVRLGSILQQIRTEDDPPGDAVAVEAGPEWVASKRLASMLVETDPSCADCHELTGPDGAPIPYVQVIIHDTMRAGPHSIRGGSSCPACGGWAQLNLDPFHIVSPPRAPAVACLLESRALVLVRSDVVARLQAAHLDVGFIPAVCDSE